jgi:hypothetical protein
MFINYYKQKPFYLLILFGFFGYLIFMSSDKKESPERVYESKGLRSAPAVGIVTFAISAAVTGVLDILGVLTAVSAPYVGTLYPGVAFQVIFGMWFGVYGALGSYIGPLLSGLVEGMGLAAAAVLKAGDFVQSLIPFLAFYYLKGDPALIKRRDWILFITFALIINNALGGLIGATAVWYFFHVPARYMFTIGYLTWVVSNWIIVIVIGIPILKVVTSYVKRTRMYLMLV